MTKQKRVLAIHDISCVGRCSLTAALPILSAAGVECSALPTAVLSTHTGGFEGYTFRDLTEDLMPIADHWKSLGLRFDAIYTGYLGSAAQIDIVKRIIEMFRDEDTVVLVDPVMADNGKLYGGFGPEFPGLMAGLCSIADIIIPNLTEACFMLGEEYREPPYTPGYIEDMLKKLSAMGSATPVLTGIDFGDGQLGAGCLSEGGLRCSFDGKLPGYFHGTGDVFGSSLLAALMCGKDLDGAVGVAVRFTRECIRMAIELRLEPRYGVCYELAAPALLRELGIRV